MNDYAKWTDEALKEEATRRKIIGAERLTRQEQIAALRISDYNQRTDTNVSLLMCANLLIFSVLAYTVVTDILKTNADLLLELGSLLWAFLLTWVIFFGPYTFSEDRRKQIIKETLGEKET